LERVGKIKGKKNLNNIIEKKKNKTEGQKRRRRECIQRKRQEAWNARPQPSIPKLRASDQIIIENQLKRIANENTNIICLDIEMYIKNPESTFSKCKNLCLWVAIIQGDENLLYESFARPKKTGVRNIGTQFNELDWNNVKFARPFNMVKKQVINYLTGADLIIRFNRQSDLKALNLTQIEIALIENKIINLVKYLSPRL